MTPRRQACLKAMGLIRWVRRAPATPADTAVFEAAGAEAAVAEPVAAGEPGRADAPGPSEAPAAAATAPGAAAEAAAAATAPTAGLDWQALQERVAACRACALHAGRNRTVFGVGSRQADWLLIGEAPGAEEDRQGEPFVGRAGRLLDAMLLALGLDRQQVYIANVVKCRPPGNRDPGAEESGACAAYLNRQIELLAPRVIVTLGRIAAQHLLDTAEPLGRLRTRIHAHPVHGVPVVATYHPAYLLRSPAEKGKAWQDLLRAFELVSGERRA